MNKEKSIILFFSSLKINSSRNGIAAAEIEITSAGAWLMMGEGRER